MLKITKEGIEKLRKFYRQNRGIMMVGRALASGKNEREAEILENQPEVSKITRHVSPYDMDIHYNSLLAAKEEEKQESSKNDKRILPGSTDHVPFYQSIKGK